MKIFISKYLQKAVTHKYLKREGTTGNYKYYYRLPDGRLGTKADLNAAVKGKKTEANRRPKNKSVQYNKPINNGKWTADEYDPWKRTVTFSKHPGQEAEDYLTDRGYELKVKSRASKQTSKTGNGQNVFDFGEKKQTKGAGDKPNVLYQIENDLTGASKETTEGAMARLDYYNGKISRYMAKKRIMATGVRDDHAEWFLKWIDEEKPKEKPKENESGNGGSKRNYNKLGRYRLDYSNAFAGKNLAESSRKRKEFHAEMEKLGNPLGADNNGMIEFALDDQNHDALFELCKKYGVKLRSGWLNKSLTDAIAAIRKAIGT